MDRRLYQHCQHLEINVPITTDSLPSCALHDYLEIACLQRYRVRIILRDGSVLTGRVLDIQTTPEKREYLVIEHDRTETVETKLLKKLEVMADNAPFKEVTF